MAPKIGPQIDVIMGALRAGRKNGTFALTGAAIIHEAQRKLFSACLIAASNPFLRRDF
jgi:hypothetical protein